MNKVFGFRGFEKIVKKRESYTKFLVKEDLRSLEFDYIKMIVIISKLKLNESIY